MTPGWIYLPVKPFPDETAPEYGDDLASARRRRLMHLRCAEFSRQYKQGLRPQLKL